MGSTTGATALLNALDEAGIDYIFANLGSDHPGLVEAMQRAKAEGHKVPQLITCPHEFVGMTAAHGHAQVSGRAQAVLVHVECGTQSLAGAVHNAARGRVPVLVLAGTSPYTQEGELPGSRNEFIQWIQDVPDQRGIVRDYMKYNQELRTGTNIKQMVYRALQISTSDPKGPSYLMAAREVLEETLDATANPDPAGWQPTAPAALPADKATEIALALAGAERPLVVTSYMGRTPAAVPVLVALCERLGIGVLESVPNAMNFPHDNHLYQGNQWNEPVQNPALAAADVILVIDSDVPWIPTVSRPKDGARIFHIDVDPLKEKTPLWYIPAEGVFRAHAATALAQIDAAVDTLDLNDAHIAEKRAHYAALHRARAERLAALEQPGSGAPTPEYVTACIRANVDADTIVLNEGITNYPVVFNHLAMTRPGSIFTSGGGSLGWNPGAAIGAKLAAPDKTVVAIGGDGCFMFSVPSTVHWMARRYRTPFVQVVFNNGGWKAPRFSTLALHPQGHAAASDDIGVRFTEPADYGAIAEAAGGAWSRKVTRTEEVQTAVAEAFRVVRDEARCAVLDIVVPQL